MRLDSAGLQVLSPAECVGLLASTPIGRVVFTDHALPAVQPVNFVLDGWTVVMRTSPESKLAVAARNTVVAFETDDFDPVSRTGWSVTVVGYARVVTDPGETERLAAATMRFLGEMLSAARAKYHASLDTAAAKDEP